MSDDAEPVEVEPTDEPTKTEPEVEVDAGDKAEGDKPKEGTPDKALQKLQQELGNATRQIAALQQKVEQPGGLSETDKAKLAKAQQRLTKIQAHVNRPDRQDLPSEVDDVAEEVLDLREKVSRQEQLEAALNETTARLAMLENDRTWTVVRSKYEGLDIDAIWKKANKDADETLGEDGTDRAKHKLASRLFEQRCEDAKKRLKDDGDKSSANNKGTAKAPSGYRVGDAVKQAPVLSEEEEALAEARSLVRET